MSSCPSHTVFINQLKNLCPSHTVFMKVVSKYIAKPKPKLKPLPMLKHRVRLGLALGLGQFTSYINSPLSY